MIILEIDTAQPQERIALWEGKKLLTEQKWEAKYDETEKLLPAIVRVLKKSKKSWQDIERISVHPGPGQYTGLRIGVTVANVLAGILKVPMYEISGKRVRIVKPRYRREPNITTPKNYQLPISNFQLMSNDKC